MKAELELRYTKQFKITVNQSLYARPGDQAIIDTGIISGDFWSNHLALRVGVVDHKMLIVFMKAIPTLGNHDIAQQVVIRPLRVDEAIEMEPGTEIIVLPKKLGER